MFGTLPYSAFGDALPDENPPLDVLAGAGFAALRRSFVVPVTMVGCFACLLDRVPETSRDPIMECTALEVHKAWVDEEWASPVGVGRGLSANCATATFLTATRLP